jgi:hypothetical protein
MGKRVAIVEHAASAAIGDDGAPSRSASARTSSPASSAPPPTKITGHSALARRSAARSIASSSSGAAPSSGKGGSNSTSARAASISGGTSIPTGRGRPERSSFNALPTIAGASFGAFTRSAHLVNLRKIPSWSGISCSRPWLLPMPWLGIWPMSASTRAPVE